MTQPTLSPNLQAWTKINPWRILKAFEVGQSRDQVPFSAREDDPLNDEYRRPRGPIGPVTKDFSCAALWLTGKPPERWTDDNYIYGQIPDRPGWIVFCTARNVGKWQASALALGANLVWNYMANGQTKADIKEKDGRGGQNKKATPEFIQEAQRIIDTEFISWSETARRLGCSATLLGGLRNRGILTERTA